MWERAFRRAKLPLAYTLGFTPHPRLTFAAPLALGSTSEGELLDVYLREALPIESLMERVSQQLPLGCEVRAAAELPVDEPPLTALTRWALYTVEVSGQSAEPQDSEEPDTSRLGSRWASAGQNSSPAGDADEPIPWRPPSERLSPPDPDAASPEQAEIGRRIDELMKSSSVLVARRRDGKSIDVRPMVLSLSLAESAAPTGRVALQMTVKLDSSGAGRPDEIATALGLRARATHRRRIGLDGEAPPA